MEQENKDPSLDDAKKIIATEKEQRSSECAKEVTMILKKYNCEFIPNLTVNARDN